jgi:hypothetical protein
MELRMKNTLTAIALALATVTAGAADVAGAAEKIPLDILIERVSDPQRSIVGKQFDTVGVLRAYTGRPRADLIGNRYHTIVDLGDLSTAERAAIYDQCDPTPCIARVLVTKLAKPPTKEDGWTVFRLDGWK